MISSIHGQFPRAWGLWVRPRFLRGVLSFLLSLQNLDCRVDVRMKVVSLASNCQNIAKSEGLLWKVSVEVTINVLSSCFTAH